MAGLFNAESAEDAKIRREEIIIKYLNLKIDMKLISRKRFSNTSNSLRSSASLASLR